MQRYGQYLARFGQFGQNGLAFGDLSLRAGAEVAAPVNLVAPAITGTTTVGALLTCSTGTWSNATSFAYQWTRNGIDLPGETNASHTITTPDTARDLNCRVTATGPGGIGTPALAAAVPIPAPELVINGTFTSDTDWGTLPTGWAIGAGVLTTSAVSAFSNIGQSEDQFEAGEAYVCSYDVPALTSGSVRVAFTGGTQRNGSTRSAVGSYSEDMVANTGNNTITIFAIAAGSSWSYDNISVKKKVVPGP